jgi:glucosylceramidase
VDTNKTFQTIAGIGGNINDATAEIYAKLPSSKQQDVLKYLFDRNKGIGLGLARTNMNSCEFSSGNYTYVNENDNTLASFNLAPDEQFKIPFIKRALETADGNLKLIVSPWSPPAYMKTNKNRFKGGSLDKSFYQLWADYFVKYIRAYEDKGIPVWGLTVQNEPMIMQDWESCQYTAEEERDFIGNYLGPTLWKNGMKNKKLIAWDYNRDFMFQRASVILRDSSAAKYVWGIGFQWNSNTQEPENYENVKRVAEAFPGARLVLTEASVCPLDTAKYDQWGEKYGASLIKDLNNGAVAWTAGNILLDENGGPNHAGRGCFALIHANSSEGSLRLTNSFFYVGHFSKFIRPDAKRVACSSSKPYLLATAFRNADGSTVVVVMNQGDNETDFRLYLENQTAEVNSLPHSIMTLVF